MPIASPIIRKVCASSIGMITNDLVEIVEADLEDRGDVIVDDPRHRAERRASGPRG